MRVKWYQKASWEYSVFREYPVSREDIAVHTMNDEETIFVYNDFVWMKHNIKCYG